MFKVFAIGSLSALAANSSSIKTITDILTRVQSRVDLYIWGCYGHRAIVEHDGDERMEVIARSENRWRVEDGTP